LCSNLFGDKTMSFLNSPVKASKAKRLAQLKGRLQTLTHGYTAFFTDFAQEKQNRIGQRCEAVSILTDLQHLRRAQLALSSEPHVSAIASTSIRESLLVRLKRATNEVTFLEDDWQDAPTAHLANR
jgi:hypothetical protein